MSAIEPQTKKKLLAFVPNVQGFSPGQRVRIELWARFLEQASWDVRFAAFEDSQLHEVMYKHGKYLAKATGLVRCFGRQLAVARQKLSVDAIFIYREASLIGPALIERVLAKKAIPIIYDIDDPVFLPYVSPMNGMASLLKCSRKTNKIFSLSHRVIAINGLIAERAREYNRNVEIFPNCIDTDVYAPRNRPKTENEIKLVWIGSQSTMQNLKSIVPALRRVFAERECSLVVIGSGKVDLGLSRVEFREWSSETEIRDLQVGDIGLLPLTDQPWNDWKFFFKVIQYMAIGIPVVACRKGSNSEVVIDGHNGFLVDNIDDWTQKLIQLIDNPQQREEMGKNARETILRDYSIQSQMPRLVRIFDDAIGRV